MSNEFLKARNAQIDEEAQRKKDSTAYILGLVEENREVLMSTLPKKGTERDDQLTERYYKALEDNINAINEEYTRAFGVTLYYLAPEEDPKTLPVLLGWMEFVPGADTPNDEGRTVHMCMPTEKGMDVVNQWRDINGWVDLKQQLKNNRDRIHNAIASANR